MRPSATLVSLGALLAVGLTLTGCGDDDGVTSYVTPFTQEPAFIEVTGTINGTVGQTIDLINDGFEAATPVGADDLDGAFYGPNPADSQESNDEWIVLYFTRLALGITTVKVDSVQWKKDGQIVDEAIGCDAVSYRHHMSQSTTETSGTYATRNVHSSFDISNLDQNTADVMGTKSVTIFKQIVNGSTTTTLEYDINIAVDMSVDKGDGSWQSGCPNTGTVLITVDYSFDTNEIQPITSIWTFDITFNDGVGTVDVTRDENNATYSANYCSIN